MTATDAGLCALAAVRLRRAERMGRLRPGRLQMFAPRFDSTRHGVCGPLERSRDGSRFLHQTPGRAAMNGESKRTSIARELSSSRVVVFAASVFAAAGCYDGIGPEGAGARVTIISGGTGSDTVGVELSQPLVVEVRGPNGRPLPEWRSSSGHIESTPIPLRRRPWSCGVQGSFFLRA